MDQSSIPPLKPIETRQDLSHLVHTFYHKVRKDDLLGPIFNARIAEADWPQHLETLTDFWEMNLLGEAAYKGNPRRTHIEVDQATDQSINQIHFHRWLSLWLETIDELYVGTLAARAKNGARRMATRQFFAIASHRPG